MIQIFKVSENSMTPDYVEGDFVLVAKIPFAFVVHPGDDIVFHRQPYGTLIKRVQAVSADGGQISVLGIHPYSVDSRTFGPISSDEVLGKVIWHILSTPSPLIFRAKWLKIGLCVLSFFLLIILLRSRTQWMYFDMGE